MADLMLVIGNRNYSSWSLRGWLMLKHTGQPFREMVIPLDQPGTAAAITEHSPSGRVPLLREGQVSVWESIAIGEYLAERFPEAALWPASGEARAVARAVSAEMHAGFATLRRMRPMNVRGRRPGLPVGPELAADIARIAAIWRECRARFGGEGPFLFGRFGIADAMFAPVVTRFVTYDVAVGPVERAYMDAVLALPAMQEWIAAAATEPWTQARYEAIPEA